MVELDGLVHILTVNYCEVQYDDITISKEGYMQIWLRRTQSVVIRVKNIEQFQSDVDEIFNSWSETSGKRLRLGCWMKSLLL